MFSKHVGQTLKLFNTELDFTFMIWCFLAFVSLLPEHFALSCTVKLNNLSYVFNLISRK